VYGKTRTSPAWLAALLLAAFLPTLTFLGHWNELFAGAVVAPAQVPVSASAMFDLTAQQADQSRHAQHCHTNLGTCSEQPMPAGIGLLTTHETLFGPPPSLFPGAPQTEALLLFEHVLVPLAPPPRSA
jgi:hypothetical protein